mgnify:CR=1 FL=1
MDRLGAWAYWKSGIDGANAFLLYRGLRRQGVYRPGAGWGWIGGRVLAANGIMGAMLWWLAGGLDRWLEAIWYLRAAWLGEAGKLALTAFFFAAVFISVRPLAPAPLLIGFIITQLMVLSGLLLRDEQEQQELGN